MGMRTTQRYWTTNILRYEASCFFHFTRVRLWRFIPGIWGIHSGRVLQPSWSQAGYKNPTIGTYVVDLEDSDSAAYLLPTPEEVLAWGEHYLYTVSWANELVVLHYQHFGGQADHMKWFAINLLKIKSQFLKGISFHDGIHDSTV